MPDGIWGWFIKDDVEILASGTSRVDCTSVEEKARFRATEIWRIGTRDKSAGEFLSTAISPTPTRRTRPPEYRQYLGAMGLPDRFPGRGGLQVRRERPGRGFQLYTLERHLQCLATSSGMRPTIQTSTTGPSLFDLDDAQLASTKTATLAIQIAGAKTGSRTEMWVNLPYTLNVNGANVGDMHRSLVI